jgi:uncharacterized protein YqcC (DUF446 family)
MDIYSLAAIKAAELEKELKRLGRWMDKTLPDDFFVDMGPFGSHTMCYEQWIQFVLIERIHEIIAERGEFPKNSNLGVYGVRYFDGDENARVLQQLLSELDQLINSPITSNAFTSSHKMMDEKNPDQI